MFGKEKKAYKTPDIEKISLSDADTAAVTGGIQKREHLDNSNDTGFDASGLNTRDSAFTNPTATATNEDKTAGAAGTGDVGQGRGRGGGCDGVAYHRNARTFSSGRNSGC